MEITAFVPFTGGVKADEISTQNCTVQTEREYVIDELGYYLSGGMLTRTLS